MTYTGNVYVQYVCALLTMPVALWPTGCCVGPFESSSLSSALLLSFLPSLLLLTASEAGGPKLLPESSQLHAVSKDDKTEMPEC